MKPEPAAIQQIPIDRIRSSVQIRPVDQEHVARLAESIKNHGLEVPIVIHRGDQGSETGQWYDLGPGRHRLEAAKKLGWKEIPAVVRPAIADAELRAEQARENLERADLTPLQEAELVEDVIEDHAGDVAAAAAALGRPQRWVEARFALLRLHPDVRELVADERLPLGHAQLIARVADQDKQLEIARQVAARKSKYGHHRLEQKSDLEPPEPLWEVRRLVDDAGRELHNVSWRLDAEFGPNGACGSCPHNSANKPGLFDGDAPKKATCLLATCYSEKSILAGRGARKAANTMIKEALPRTAKGAEQAAAVREVVYVAPKAVLAAATRAAKVKKARAAGEEAEPINLPKRDTPEQKLRSALNDWERDAHSAIEKAAKASPTLSAFLDILSRTRGAADLHGKTAKGQARNDLDASKALARRAADVNAAALLEAAKLYAGWLDLYDLHEEVTSELVSVLKIKLRPKPTLESVKAEIAKQAKAKAKKKAGTKDVAAKGGKTRVKKRTKRNTKPVASMDM